jgi:ketosteroid isomerase-like protein
MSHLDDIRSGYAAYSRRDFSFIDDVFAEDIEWTVAGPPEPVRGRDGVRAFFDGLVDQFAGHEITIEDAVEVDDRLICFVRHDFRRHDGAQTPSVAAVHDWRFRGRQATSLREIADTLSFAVAAGMIPADALPQLA